MIQGKRCRQFPSFFADVVIRAWQRKYGCRFIVSVYFPGDLSACPKERRFRKRRGGWKATTPRGRISERGRIDHNGNNSSLNEEPGTIPGRNKYAKSYKCPGEPCAPEANTKEGERLPRPPFETFSLRQRRCNEGSVLGVP